MRQGRGFLTDLGTVLRGGGFRRLFAIRLSGQLGDGVFQIAIASYIFFAPERATTAPAAAQAFAVLLLPYSLVGPFAGVLLDRWRRRQVLLVANIIRAVVVGVVTALMLGGAAGAGLLAGALVVLSVNRFILAGLSASLPHVVHRDELVMANAVFPTCGTIAAMAGAGVGFAVRQLTSADLGVAAAAAVLYLAAGLAALSLPADALGPDDDPARPSTRRAVRHVMTGLLDGARHVSGRPAAAWALTAIGVHRFFYGISTVAMILLSRNYLHVASDTEAGLATLATILLVSGAGFLAAAWLTPLATARISKERWAVILLVVSAVTVVAPGGLFTLPAICVSAFALGLASQGLKIVVDTLVQENIDDAYRGRVFSFYDVLFNVTFVAAAFFAALTLPASGKSYLVLTVMSIGYALTALVYRRMALGGAPEGRSPATR